MRGQGAVVGLGAESRRTFTIPWQRRVRQGMGGAALRAHSRGVMTCPSVQGSTPAAQLSNKPSQAPSAPPRPALPAHSPPPSIQGSLGTPSCTPPLLT